jgi:hypothetical protein
MGRTMCIDLDTERREKEKTRVIYEREVCLATSPASGQLYIYMQQELEIIQRVTRYDPTSV